MTNFHVVGAAINTGECRSVEAFWNLIKTSQVSISDFSDKYKDLDSDIICKKNLVCNVDLFDHNFFDLSYKDACKIDPQLRQLLLLAREALADGGISDYDEPKNISVYASVNHNTYYSYLENSSIESPGFFLDRSFNDPGFYAGRIAYHLNLSGAAVNINTACSSSLVALNNALMDLEFNNRDAVLVIGANITFPKELGYRAKKGMIYSLSGEYLPLTDQADGIVEGDGVVALLIKRSVCESGKTYGTIVSSYVNSDGNDKFNFFSPSPEGVKDVIRTCLNKADLKLTDLSFIECHGTGTKAGDIIEIEALDTLLKSTDSPINQLYIHSVKANFGHLLHVSGLLGVLKACLVTKFGYLPAQIHHHNGSFEHFTSRTDLLCNTEPVELEGQTLMGGITGLGMAGTNAHIIISNSVDKFFSLKTTADITWDMRNCWYSDDIIYPNQSYLQKNDRSEVFISLEIVLKNFVQDYLEDDITEESLWDIHLDDFDSFTLLTLSESIEKLIGKRIDYGELISCLTLSDVKNKYGNGK
ncbi:MAG: hypothetical protein CENE_00167 [Candidatus Celerinatantimonas neptuna]|nr:MAG: hypothetical protein CENE_00167 [Candidatus Celerinatantimonas neptuna]